MSIPRARQVQLVNSQGEPISFDIGILAVSWTPPPGYAALNAAVVTGQSANVETYSVANFNTEIHDLLADHPDDELAMIPLRLQIQQASGFDVGLALENLQVQLWNSDEDGDDHLQLGIMTGYRALPVGRASQLELGQLWVPFRNAGTNPTATLVITTTLNQNVVGDNVIITVTVPTRAPYSAAVATSE